MKSYLVKIIKQIVKKWRLKRINKGCDRYLKHSKKIHCKYEALIAEHEALMALARKYEETYNVRLLREKKGGAENEP